MDLAGRAAAGQALSAEENIREAHVAGVVGLIEDLRAGAVPLELAVGFLDAVDLIASGVCKYKPRTPAVIGIGNARDSFEAVFRVEGHSGGSVRAKVQSEKEDRIS